MTNPQVLPGWERQFCLPDAAMTTKKPTRSAVSASVAFPGIFLGASGRTALLAVSDDYANNNGDYPRRAPAGRVGPGRADLARTPGGDCQAV